MAQKTSMAHQVWESYVTHLKPLLYWYAYTYNIEFHHINM
jgi:hypothetical protein